MSTVLFPFNTSYAVPLSPSTLIGDAPLVHQCLQGYHPKELKELLDGYGIPDRNYAEAVRQFAGAISWSSPLDPQVVERMVSRLTRGNAVVELGTLLDRREGGQVSRETNPVNIFVGCDQESLRYWVHSLLWRFQNAKEAIKAAIKDNNPTKAAFLVLRELRDIHLGSDEQMKEE